MGIVSEVAKVGDSGSRGASERRGGFSARRFSWIVVGVGVLLPILAIGLFNFAIDPYGIWRPARGSTAYGVSGQQISFRFTKAYEVRWVKPTNIALGTSRVFAGIDPQSPFWPPGVTCNLGLAAATVDEMAAYLVHAQTVSPVKHVVFGLDFFAFNGRAKQYNDDYSEWRLAQHDGTLGSVPERLSLTFSVATAAEGAKTLMGRAQERESATVYFDRDTKMVADLEKDADPAVRRRIFLSTIERFLTETYFPAPDRTYGFARRDGTTTFESFAGMLRMAHREGIEMKLFVSPVHVALMEAMDATGLWPAFERWKQGLAETNERVAKEFDREPFPCWDFSGYNEVTGERLPSAGSAEQMENYSDPSHYVRAIGERILETVFVGPTPGFGRELSVRSFEMLNETIRAERERWRGLHAEEAELYRVTALDALPPGSKVELGSV